MKLIKVKRILFGLLLLIFMVMPISGQDNGDAYKVKISWDANPEPDIDHYIVYWGVESGKYLSNSGEIFETFYVVELPGNKLAHYFAVTAVDIDGFESDFSDEVDTERPSKPGGVTCKVLD